LKSTQSDKSAMKNKIYGARLRAERLKFQPELFMIQFSNRVFFEDIKKIVK